MAPTSISDPQFEDDLAEPPPARRSYVVGSPEVVTPGGADGHAATSVGMFADDGGAVPLNLTFSDGGPWGAVQYAPSAPPTLGDEVTFISGLNPDGTLAYTSFAAWNPGTNPADYSGGYTLALKWGAPTAGTTGGTVSYYFDPNSSWSFLEKTVFAAGLALWSAEVNISFAETSDAGTAQITFTRGHDSKAFTDPGTVSPRPPGAGVTDGTTLLELADATISIDTSVAGFGPITTNFSSYGGYPWAAVLHEEGHAIGLGHSGPYNTTKTASQQFSSYDTRLWSLMSYFDNSGGNRYPITNTTSWNGSYPVTPMIADILAAQRIYGTPVTTPLSGGQVFGFDSNITGYLQFFFDFTVNTKPVITLWSAGTNNTLNLSGFTTSSTVSLVAGTFSSVGGLTNNIAIAPNTAIDIFVGGSGADTVIANNNGDTIHGGGGNDTITGGTGNDRIEGGAGNNIIDGGGGTDTAVYSGILASYTITYGANGTVGVSGLNAQDSLTGVEYLAFADRTVSAATPYNVVTSNGNSLSATAGDDYISSSNGRAGSSAYYASYLQATSGVTVNLSVAAAQATGGSGTDTLVGINGLIGSSYNDTLTGNAGNNSIDGQAGDDILNGGGGDDELTGGDGTDTVVFSGVRSAYVLANTGNGLKVSGADGVDTLTGIEYLAFADGTISAKLPFTPLPASDFNGDGITELVSQYRSGQLVLRSVTGSSVSDARVAGGNPGAGWQIKGGGDFDGDGKSDVVWQDASGQALVWLMKGAAIRSSGIAGSALGSGWNIVGIGDFNFDGESDLLWQDGSGSLRFWHMAGISVASTAQSSSPGYFVKGVGDFNGDGQSDFLYQYNNTGLLGEITSEGFSGGGIANSDDAATRVAAVGDFNGDGYSDILRQKSDGSISVWLMNGAHVISAGATVNTLDSTWRVTDIGDVNGDHLQDIAWRNTAGQTSLWLMNGVNISSMVSIAPPPSAPPASDFNSDGYADLLWRDNQGNNLIWYMSAAGPANVMAPAMSTSYAIAGMGDFNKDGYADLLWRNGNTGETRIWFASTSGFNLATFRTVPTDYKVAGTGDFNNDGYVDVLWRDNEGNNLIWYLSASGATGVMAPTMAVNYAVAGIADFNADGYADILWRNAGTGETRFWTGSAAGFSPAATTRVMNTDYKVAGTGDLNNDGYADVLWRDNEGNNLIWYLSASGPTGVMAPAISNSYAAASIGDFNNDGYADVLWRNPASGEDKMWFSSSTGFSLVTSRAMPTDYKVAAGAVPKKPAGADFNNDGYGDVLWRDSAGNNMIWYMSAAGPTGVIAPTMSSGFAAAGMADFNSDGYTDVLWRNGGTGETRIWSLTAAGVSAAMSWTMPTDYKVAGTGDFNNDGYVDVLWRDNAGNNLVWFMSAAGSTGVVAPTMSAGNAVAGIGDFNNDGYSDILWHNSSTGEARIWSVSAAGFTPGTSRFMPMDYKVAGNGDFNNDGYVDVLWRDNAGNNLVWYMSAAGPAGVMAPTMSASYAVAAIGDFNNDGIATCCGATRAAAKTRSGMFRPADSAW